MLYGVCGEITINVSRKISNLLFFDHEIFSINFQFLIETQFKIHQKNMFNVENDFRVDFDYQ